jgi:hypothetical protein
MRIDLIEYEELNKDTGRIEKYTIMYLDNICYGHLFPSDHDYYSTRSRSGLLKDLKNRRWKDKTIEKYPHGGVGDIKITSFNPYKNFCLKRRNIDEEHIYDENRRRI